MGQPLTRGKVGIEVDTDESRVIDDVRKKALGRRHENQFVRSGKICYIDQTTRKKTTKVKGAEDSPRIVFANESLIRTEITRICKLVQSTTNPEGEKNTKVINPPAWLSRGVSDAMNKGDMRRLAGLSLAPIIRTDGTIWNQPGWDKETEMYIASAEPFPDITPASTPLLASAAARRLLEPAIGFPFRGECDRSVFLSAVLTPLARTLFDGPTPLHLFNANVMGSGKGKLINIAAMISTGYEAPSTSLSESNEEIHKQITSVVIDGSPVLHFDNLPSGQAFGGAIIDALLTATYWKAASSV